MTVGEAVIAAAERLDTEPARLDAEVLMAHQLSRSRSWVLAHTGDTLPANELAGFSTLIDRRQTGVPVAQLTGRREFYGREFGVTADVLVPRPESELLVETVLASLKGIGQLIDVGTGSGCLAVTCKLERPELAVVATDRSPAALAVARRNADQLAAEVMFREADLLPAELPDPARTVVMANLPYVPDDDYAGNPDLRHEPALALRGGSDGLAVINRLFDQLEGRSWFPAMLALEIDPSQVDAIEQRAAWPIEVRPDLAGRDRIVVIRA